MADEHSLDIDALIAEVMTNMVVPWAERRLGDPIDPNLVQEVLVHPILDFLAWSLVQYAPLDQLEALTAAIGATLSQSFEGYVQLHVAEHRDNPEA
jgi:hypothetical protein